MVVHIFAGPRRLGTCLTQNVVLLRAQFRTPLFLGFDDFGHGRQGTARYQVSTQGRFLPSLAVGSGAARITAEIVDLVSAGSMTSSISKWLAALSALPFR